MEIMEKSKLEILGWQLSCSSLGLKVLLVLQNSWHRSFMKKSTMNLLIYTLLACACWRWLLVNTHIGIKPASLGKVNNPQVKQFIEKCLVPASLRLPAMELLKDPFLASENLKEHVFNPLQLPNIVPKEMSLPHCELHPMDIDLNHKKLSDNSSIESNNERQFLTLELQQFTENNEFRLRGEKNEDNTISLTLCIIDRSGHVSNIHFIFYLDSDTAILIAEEMVEQLGLSHDCVIYIAELIDNLIVKLVPSWNPSFCSTSSLPHSSCYDSTVRQNNLMSLKCMRDSEETIKLFAEAVNNEGAPMKLGMMKYQDTQESFSSGVSTEFDVSVTSSASTDISFGHELHKGFNACGFSSHYSVYDKTDEINVGEPILMSRSMQNSETSFIGSYSDISKVPSLVSSISSDISDKDHLCSELNMELDAIAIRYDQSLQELQRLREEVM